MRHGAAKTLTGMPWSARTTPLFWREVGACGPFGGGGAASPGLVVIKDQDQNMLLLHHHQRGVPQAVAPVGKGQGILIRKSNLTA